MKRLGLVGVAVVAVAALTSSAFAVDSTLPAITFPFTLESAASTLTAAGVACLGVWFVPKMGFKYIRSLIGKLSNATR